jgi:hypothetical protein
MTPNKLLLLIGCLGLLISNAQAADSAGAKSDLSATATNSYQIRNQKFGDLLRPKDANNAEGTRIVLYPAQPWKCMTWKLRPAGENVYQVQNHFTSKTFVIKPGNDERNVVQTAFPREATERPTWQFTKLTDGSYKISDPKSGEVLTAVDGDGRAAQVVAAPWQEKPEQKWLLEKIDPASLTM